MLQQCIDEKFQEVKTKLLEIRLVRDKILLDQERIKIRQEMVQKVLSKLKKVQ